MSTSLKDTRSRLMATAVQSFRVHSVAGTSLQMISDELGLTKSAIYHHFRTRDELLEAILAPVMAELETLVAAAGSARGARAQADAMLTGFTALAVARRDLIPVLTGDPGVGDFLRNRPDWSAVVQRQLALLAGVEPGMGGQVKAAVVLAGISAAVGVDYPEAGDDLDRLRAELIAAGRRTLGLRAPRGT